MSINWGVTDILAIAKLSWDLYHGCYLVARGAPDEFRMLVNELCSLQGVLRSLRDDISSDKSYLDRLDENRKETLEKCLQSCVMTLQKLEKLTNKYRKLGIGDGPQFWTKFKWTTKQKEIAQIRNNIMVHTCNLSLCMSSIGNSSLARIEMSMERALERQGSVNAGQSKEVQEQDMEDEGDDELLPLKKTSTGSIERSRSADGDGLGIGKLTHQLTGSTLVDSHNMSPDATPSPGEDDSRQLGSPQDREMVLLPWEG
ncbi:uncharacterized protein KY384_003033 [Bacidia gigantensis]|uniref:uncharacterized protein n=1 Tax=Bacidia gigantensis TaxID=2732470 RepID=UPI001D059828|nr:uncharacterized protein KY384_003033 [Bacidia gigantensis]KAG8531404.1 hypothetical protein KY384_003033 [Bacidia gigantensis]